MIRLRTDQQNAVSSARDFLRGDAQRLLFASATGTGKSYVELELLRESGGVLLTPSNEIMQSLLEKLGHSTIDSESRLRKVGAEHSVYTPLSFRNALLAGRLEPPAFILWDEVHHHNADTWGDVSSLCDVKEIGFTATPYRGTAKGTAKFREVWGEPHWIYTWEDAVEKGFITLPHCTTSPLLDDDTVEIVAGEFHVASVEAETRSRLVELARLIRSYPLNTPTMVALPTRALCAELAELLPDAVIVTGDTSREDRNAAYAKCLASKAVLIQVRVVGEGIDLPIRRLFDASPTLSPVAWVQVFGRLTRPGGESLYVCTNRNLLRHCYALEGVLSVQSVADAQNVFGLGSRSGGRAFGLEGLGRFKANPLPLANGLQGEVYVVESVIDSAKHQYACVLHPLHPMPLWARRVNVAGNYGTWSQCESPEGFKGFTSCDGRAPTDKQKAWWTKAASRYGLDPDAKLNRRTFAALPILADLGVKLEN